MEASVQDNGSKITRPDAVIGEHETCTCESSKTIT